MKILIAGGAVVRMDPAIGDLDRGDVLLEDGLIVEVAERIDAPGAEVIDATERIVLPGFVDNHRHTWQTAFRGVGADWTFAQYLARRPCVVRLRPGTRRRHCENAGSRRRRSTCEAGQKETLKPLATCEPGTATMLFGEAPA